MKRLLLAIVLTNQVLALPINSRTVGEAIEARANIRFVPKPTFRAVPYARKNVPSPAQRKIAVKSSGNGGSGGNGSGSTNGSGNGPSKGNGNGNGSSKGNGNGASSEPSKGNGNGSLKGPGDNPTSSSSKGNGNGNGNGNGSGPSGPGKKDSPGGYVNGQSMNAANLLVQGNGNGNGNGRAIHMKDLTKFPPATASAQTYASGQIATNTDEKLRVEKLQVSQSKGFQDRKEVQAPIAVSAAALMDEGGGRSSASASGQVAARMHNKPGSKGCIRCTLPGEEPIEVTGGSSIVPIQVSSKKVDSARGTANIEGTGPGKIEWTFPGQNPVRIHAETANTVSVKATNKFPHKGPIKIEAWQDGPGFTSAAASNKPE